MYQMPEKNQKQDSKKSTPHDLPEHVLYVCTRRVKGRSISSNITWGLVKCMQIRGVVERMEDEMGPKLSDLA